MKHHVIISGTGRAGTTFLVQLLTALECDTGFSSPTEGIWENCNAGMEHDIRLPSAPYFVKSPWLCDYLNDVLAEGNVCIDHAIVPIRNLADAAESRIRVSQKAEPRLEQADVPGGLWHTKDPLEQEGVLAKQLYKLLHTLTMHDVPTLCIEFPRLAHDRKYLYVKLQAVLPKVDYVSFCKAFDATVKPALIHKFV